MSDQTVEIVRRAMEAHSRMDANAMVAICDAEVEYQSRITAVDEVRYQGNEGIRHYIARLAEVFDWINAEPLEVLEDADSAVVTNRFRARGRGGGVEVEQRFLLRSGSATASWSGWEAHGSKQEALEAASLSE